MRIDQFTDLNDYKVICIVGPKRIIQQGRTCSIGTIPRTRGRLYIALNHAVGQISYSQNNGFHQPGRHRRYAGRIRAKKINYDFVVDNYCGRILVTQDQGFYNSKVTAISHIYLSSRTSVLT